ncbi:MAG TPA: HAD hydrolase-like protein [Gemmatimonadales bacterium]
MSGLRRGAGLFSAFSAFSAHSALLSRRLVLFDIDGTLLWSRGAGRRALLAAMAGEVPGLAPLHPARAAEIRFDGKTDPRIVVELLQAAGIGDPEEPRRIAGILERYVSFLERELAVPGHRTEVLPGVVSLLARVEAAEGAVLGLLTGNVAMGARLKLRSAALEPERFRVGAFGSDHADRARLPSIATERAIPWFGRTPHGAEVVIVGDTPADVTCGIVLGARAIGVATGSYSAEELAQAGAAAVFRDLSATDMVWEAIWA